MRSARKFGTATASTSSSATSASTGQNSVDAVKRRRPERGSSAMGGSVPARDELHDLADRRLGPGQLRDLVVVAQHGDPVGEPEDLLQLGGDVHDGHAVLRQVD